MSLRVISFGCDPEIFVKNQQGDVCSAIGHFGGTKEHPKPIKILGEGFAVQEDNVLVEFNIPPAKDGAEFVKSVQATVDVLAKRALRKGLSFTQGSAFSLKPEYLEDAKARVFGCDPDYNAYTGRANPAPRAKDKCLRSAGGHIALGLEDWATSPTPHGASQNEWARHIVRNLDFLWGIPSILLDDGELRKELYGKAGAYRVKPFGVEYRTLSNFWVFKPKLAEAMLNKVLAINTQQARIGGSTAGFGNFSQPITSDVLETGINTNNKEWAMDMIKKYPQHFDWTKEFIPQ